MFILLVLALVWVGMAIAQRAPAMPIAFNVIVTAFGALVTLIVLYRILNQPGPNDFITVEFGAYLGFLLCVGITAGGFLAMRDEGTSMADARAQAEGLLSSRGTTRPAGTEPRAGVLDRRAARERPAGRHAAREHAAVGGERAVAGRLGPAAEPAAAELGLALG